MTQNIQFSDELYLLGSRDYVQGLCQLKFAWLTIMKTNHITDPAGIMMCRYKQINELKSPARLNEAGIEKDAKNVCATVDVRIAEVNKKYLIVPFKGILASKPEHSYQQANYNFDRTSLVATALLETKGDFWQVLEEAVQLTKMMHIDCYNAGNVRQKYKFVVGGAENLGYFEPVRGVDILLKISIKHSWTHNDHIYNTTRVEFIQESLSHDFILPFVGKPIT